MSLRAKFRLIVGAAACGLLAISVLWVESERSQLLAERQAQARNLVAVPYSILEQQYRWEKEGRMSREEAQRQAIAALRAIRYDRDNYFWINDMHPTMVMHPVWPQMEGQDLTGYRDPTGKAMFVEMVQTVTRQGDGFVRYRWPRPGKQRWQAVAKLSYVRGFEPWGWVIGTGIYVDDLDAAWRRSATTAIGLAALCLLAVLLISAGVSRSVFGRLGILVARMKEIASGTGDFSAGFQTGSPYSHLSADEIDVLMAGFNEMLGEIKKRDAQLRQHSQELEQQVAARTENLRTLNHELAAAHAEIGLFLECIPSILIGLDAAGHITRWNLTAAQTFSLSAEQVEGKTLDQCGIRWLHRNMTTELAEWLKSATIRYCDDLAYENEGEVHFVGFAVRRIYSQDSEKTRFIVTGADVTQKKNLEEQLRQAHKLEAIGQLAAGIAHEINTPTQYIGDNTTFLKESWQQILKVLELCRGMHREGAGQGSVLQPSLADLDRLCEECDLTFLLREIPRAIDESLNGLQQVAKIVRAMKEFSHAGSEEKEPFDLNSAIAATITVARSEWKHVAEVEFVPDPELPVAQGLAGELKQVILNLIVNAAHAIGDVVGDGASGKGKITVTTRCAGDCVEVAVSDTGAGIPEKIRSRVFELFFTTKPVGQGTGQGLAVAHTIVVKRHQGQIWFDTEVGKGTTFYVRLPLEAKAAAGAE